MTDYIDAAINILLGRNVSKTKESRQETLDKALDNLAEMIQESDETFAKAYVRILDSNFGRLIYTAKADLPGGTFTNSGFSDAMKANNLARKLNISS